jgi:hypothetical protein
MRLVGRFIKYRVALRSIARCYVMSASARRLCRSARARVRAVVSRNSDRSMPSCRASRRRPKRPSGSWRPRKNNQAKSARQLERPPYFSRGGRSGAWPRVPSRLESDAFAGATPCSMARPATGMLTATGAIFLRNGANVDTRPFRECRCARADVLPDGRRLRSHPAGQAPS